MAKRHKHYTNGGNRKSGGGRPKGSKKYPPNRRKPRNPAKDTLLGSGDLVNPHLVEDYYFGNIVKENSLKSGVYRPGRLHDRDVNLRKLPLRNRPVDFIKAKDVYDPSHEMIMRLKAKQEKKIPITEFDTESSDSNLTRNETNGFCEDSEDKALDDEEEGSHQQDTGEITELNTKTNQTLDGELFFEDRWGSQNVDYKNLYTTDDLSDESNSAASPNMMMHQQDTNAVHPFSSYIKNVMKNMAIEELDSDNELESCTQSEEEEKEYSGSMEDNMQHLTLKEGLGSDSLTSDIPACTSTVSVSRASVDSDYPEFGMLEEDFIGNVGNISVSNIRLGASNNLYFVSCAQLFGTDEHRWLDHNLMLELLEELGLPSHRIPAYLKYVKDLLIPPESTELENEYDINFDDTEEEEEEKEEDDDYDDYDYDFDDQLKGNISPLSEDMREGLDDLIFYSVSLEKDRNLEYQTQSLALKGKGKRKNLQFDVNYPIDQETKTILQDTFSTRQLNKAKKRRTKMDFLSEQHANSRDLLLKYPFGLHIQNIRDEFDSFYQSNRVSITFPPLDPHGNKVLSKFANNYFMKSSRIGKGKSTKIYVEKTKRTKYNQPAYHIINQLVKQRPIFMRIDVRSSNFQENIRNPEKFKENFHIKDGKVVGEDAPEISADNIGRQMLEKLGWSRGQGLGAHGNKGINEPIMAKIKKNKSGLRHFSKNEL